MNEAEALKHYQEQIEQADPEALAQVMREHPEWADWYVAMERTTGARFRKDWPNYAELRRLALMSPPLPFNPHDEGISCFCGD